MKNTNWLTVVVLIVLVLLLWANPLDISFQLRGAGEQTSGVEKGDLAAEITAQTLDGQAFRLSELRGRVVVLNAFASWCAPCRAETPELVQLYNERSAELVVVGLNIEETPQAVSAYRDDFEVTYPLLLNTDGHLTEIYRPIGIPTSWVIDREGIIQYVHTGPLTEEMLAEVLAGEMR